MTWRRKEPGHQQPWYWHSLYEIFYCLLPKYGYDDDPHMKGYSVGTSCLLFITLKTSLKPHPAAWQLPMAWMNGFEWSYLRVVSGWDINDKTWKVWSLRLLYVKYKSLTTKAFWQNVGCQPHRMGHGQHRNLNMNIAGHMSSFSWIGGEPDCSR